MLETTISSHEFSVEIMALNNKTCHIAEMKFTDDKRLARDVHIPVANDLNVGAMMRLNGL